MNVEKVYAGSSLLAVVYRVRGAAPATHGITFLTEADRPQQMAVMSWPAGHVVSPHVHLPVRRVLDCPTWECLFISRGEAVLDLYDAEGKQVRSFVLLPGNLALLCSGGHGLRFVRDSEVVEVKLGPYAGEDDKRPLPTPIYLQEEAVCGAASTT